MFDHISIGVRELPRTKRFYDATLGALGYDCLSADESSLGYGKGSVGLWIGAVPAPVPSNSDSNLHFCFVAPTRQSVDAFHAAALAADGSDNGKPGLRESYGPDYYAAFVVDPDGYRLEAYCSRPA